MVSIVALRIGLDLVSVAEVEEAMRLHADRYLTRVYSARELDDCRGSSSEIVAERLAGRFAAKEAAIKLLRPGAEEHEQGVGWSSIEVVRDRSGAPELTLTGRAAELARDAGLTGLSVSITHERTFAAAVVVGEVSQ
ncbi:MAG TPA: holo-ACP synthase [Gaiellaceae bacterium]|jgi:holo-[acyl-carrier protein] synthase